ncbi:MAG: choice-of-anchor Q domain-containing protein [Bacteroidota bacterium]
MSISKSIGRPVIFFLLFIFFSTAQAATIYVDQAVTGGLNNGSSWADAYANLQIALATASAGDEIWVAQGSYYPTTTLTRSFSFQIPSDVALYGGFSGNGTETLRDQRDPANNTTILSGDLGQDGLSSNNAYTVVYVQGVSLQTILDGFTISDGNADNPAGSNPTPSRSGGGLYNDGFVTPSSPTIRNCIFRDNIAASFGGAIYNNGDCSSIIDNCRFFDNTAFAGGALYNAGSLLKDCSPSLSKCDFQDNYGTDAAGAVYNDGNIGTSSPIFASCSFSRNHTDSSRVTYAGAVYNLGKSGVCNPRFFNCLFNANYTYAGGAVYNLGQLGTCNPDFVNCTIYNNRAAFNGGALYANAGGQSNGICELEIDNCIFSDNQAGPSGGDIFRNNYGCITLNNSIVDLADCNALNAGSGKAVVCNNTLFATDPLFEDVHNDDFTLQPTSPAIDAGDNSPVSANEITIDLACNPRIDGALVDIGAYEYQGALPVELATFDAYFDGKAVQLSWTTLSEQDNDYFTVERSADGQRWTAIEEVEGAGNSLQAIRYQAEDAHPVPGSNYYRLRQTDFNQSEQFSTIRVVKVVESRISIYPNPVIEGARIALGDFDEEQLTVSIHSIDGQLIFQQQQTVDRNVQILEVEELAALQPGTYVLSVASDRVKQQSLIFSKVGM